MDTNYKLKGTDAFFVLEAAREPAPPVMEGGAAEVGANIVFSAHGDTCFGESCCIHVPGSNGQLLFGQMDNAAGVHAMMNAYFSGRLPRRRVQCQVTHGEERATNGVFFAGAREIMKTLQPEDFVVVIDVTGCVVRVVDDGSAREAREGVGHIVIEKVRSNKKVMALLDNLRGRRLHMSGMPTPQSSLPIDSSIPYTYDVYNFCNDPQAFVDETDAYGETQPNTVFLGLPVSGGTIGDIHSDGDYNAGGVFCWQKDIKALTEVIIELANIFISPAFQEEYKKI